MERSKSLSRCSSNLPEELIREILSRACVISLHRCRLVCKSWESIIINPEFLEAQHLRSHKNVPSVLMITSRTDEEERGGEEGRFYGHRAATIVYPNYPEYSVNLPIMQPFDNVDFVSSCNGIVCASESFHSRNDFRGNIYLFNPLNWLSKTLPPSIVYENQHLLFVGFDVVFGFDFLSADYKVLKIGYQRINGRLVKLQAVQLYSFDSGLWKEIEVAIELPSLLCYPACPTLSSGPVVDGVLYLEAVNTIITFDLHNELFGLIPYPSFMHTRKSNVLDFEGSVAVVLESVTEGSSPDKKETGCLCTVVLTSLLEVAALEQ
ncbi:F-box protein At3g07870-like [Apium graveolens]|uniref:F-box protein At3g07870-like n=1 Tax=Apium graveolens TaxID=4045 RepID=UPI003D7B4070